MERLNSPVPYLTTKEYRKLIAEATYHWAQLCGFQDGNVREYWRQAEQRVLTVISDIGAQYDGNTKLLR
jgi:hypothetical protein